MIMWYMIWQAHLFYPRVSAFQITLGFQDDTLNPLPHMPMLGSSNSEANLDIKSKIWTNGDTII